MTTPRPYAQLRRAAFWLLIFLLVLAGTVTLTALLPLESWIRILPESVSTTSGDMGTETFSYHLDASGDAPCQLRPVTEWDEETGKFYQTGIQAEGCHLPARTALGVVHEIAAALLLPALSACLYLGWWAAEKRRPKLWVLNTIVVLTCLVLIVVSWWRPIEFGVEMINGVAREKRPQESFLERLQSSTFTIGLGGLVGVIATQVFDKLLRWAGVSVERGLSRSQKHKRKQERSSRKRTPLRSWR